jgi:cytochrome c oxidase subunit 4
MIIAYWIAFGPHGPRADAPPGESAYVLKYTIISLIAAGVLFAGVRSFAKPPPKTMTKEWQEATNEYLKVRDNIPNIRHSMLIENRNKTQNQSLDSI